MYIIKQTGIFSNWLKKLKDIKGKVAILRRIDRLKEGNFGDYKYLGNNISELRFSIGPGYRIYYTVVKNEIILLLIGGDKSSQTKDIEKAKEIYKGLKNE